MQLGKSNSMSRFIQTSEKPSINGIESDYNGGRDTEQISGYNNKIYST